MPGMRAAHAWLSARRPMGQVHFSSPPGPAFAMLQTLRLAQHLEGPDHNFLVVIPAQDGQGRSPQGERSESSARPSKDCDRSTWIPACAGMTSSSSEHCGQPLLIAAESLVYASRRLSHRPRARAWRRWSPAGLPHARTVSPAASPSSSTSACAARSISRIRGQIRETGWIAVQARPRHLWIRVARMDCREHIGQDEVVCAQHLLDEGALLLGQAAELDQRCPNASLWFRVAIQSRYAHTAMPIATMASIGSATSSARTTASACSPALITGRAGSRRAHGRRRTPRRGRAAVA